MSAITFPIDGSICLSGGADGADLQFGMTAGKAGQMVRHFSFAGHRSKAPIEEIVILTDDQLKIADEYLKKVNETLKRSWPVRNPYTANLLRRNYYQVAYSDAVYAVSTIENGLVTGGTSWAVQMFLDRHQNEPCAAYVFDQDQACWYSWEGHWQKIESPPFPIGVWAGIGTRKLNEAGKAAIRTLMKYQASGLSSVRT